MMMTTIRVRLRSASDDRCMLIGAEKLDPYLAQTLAEDLRRNAGTGASLEVDVPRGPAPRTMGMLVRALESERLRVHVMPEEASHAR